MTYFSSGDAVEDYEVGDADKEAERVVVDGKEEEAIDEEAIGRGGDVGNVGGVEEEGCGGGFDGVEAEVKIEDEGVRD
ncbi:hypothetical protein C3L33_15452, partial [Rhododendron williamsianum]